MRIYKYLIASLALLFAWSVQAHIPGGPENAKAYKNNRAQLRGVCANSNSEIDQDINNVRARLLGGGDCWWNFNDGRYVVPKVDPASGQQEVSALFAGSVWLGGVDPAGNLKLACQDYRSSTTNEFWPGPLTESGLTDEGTCKNWDRHFEVTGEEIRQHLTNLAEGVRSESAIPLGLRGWPARGNPYFFDVWGFDLPYNSQGLAGFFDKDGDGDYDPLKGDYPSIDIRGCPLDRYPDQMIFWIYNDQGAGAPHGNTNGRAIQMEVQVQAFGYVTSDELNDMTFQRYKLINRATEYIDSTFFAMWTDPDLGCHLDDYIGCDTTADLMYVYNQDQTDGQPGCACGGVATYCNEVPVLGIDYFRGPLRPINADSSVEIGMSSFVYYNNSIGPQVPGTTDPGQDIEFYRFLTGYWKDGEPFTYGGNGKGGARQIKYAFTDAPDDANGWSMCTANLTYGDRRTLQASGPFRLNPGAVNELIIGVPFVPDAGSCPDLEPLLRADKLAQGLFDNCFERLEGPDAPDVSWIENNQQVVAVLTNTRKTSNNFGEGYEQFDFLAPDSLRKSSDPSKQDLAKYKFEGYLIYQLADPNVSSQDYDNPEKSRLVYQVDIRNGVSKVYNWEELRNPINPKEVVYFPQEIVDGQDKGIRHTFSIADDKFATGNDKRLINHKKYYYSVVAYAYNNFGNFTFSPKKAGQQTPYLGGSRNIQIYTVIPRPIVDKSLKAAYGEGVEITRLEGVGAGGTFLDVTDASREAMLQTGYDSTVTYKPGRAPIGVTIFNPFEVKDGDYELSFSDSKNDDNKVDDNSGWVLKNLTTNETVASERTIDKLNEQIVPNFGFSVTIGQTGETGNYTPNKIRPAQYPTSPGENNGAIGAEIVYQDPNGARWLNGVPDDEGGPFHYVKTKKLEDDETYDPGRALSKMGDGWFVPYALCDYKLYSAGTFESRLFTPAWTTKSIVGASPAWFNASVVGGNNLTDANNRFRKLNALPNVDIVFTSDKSKWSRCVVVESASEYFYGNEYAAIQRPELQTESPATRKRRQFDVRYSLSVGKDDTNNDGLPDPDGAKDASGNPIYGMGWFPGYAVDVETGKRLNVFFGENSAYSKQLFERFTGRDMLWNPTDQFAFFNGPTAEYYNFIMGGQHWVYVTNTEYDGCEQLRRRLTPEGQSNPDNFKVQQMRNIAWAGMLYLQPGTRMRSLSEGLIPNNAIVKLRVENPFQTWFDDNNNKRKIGHPKYRFKISNRQASDLDAVQVENALDSIKVVPNPYYGFSQYEINQFSNLVKITNLPAKCDVTIYSLDGKFIRQYRRDEQYAPYRQITPDIEWDLKNNKGIPVASGVYLIQVQAPGMGERTIKWFGIGRQFDPSGL